jgi:hypothetical protein
MIKRIRIIPLFLGILIGVFIVFFVKQEKEIVYKYPTPDNVNNTIYKDKNGVCYKYSAKSVDCDKNESRLKDFPLSK